MLFLFPTHDIRVSVIPLFCLFSLSLVCSQNINPNWNRMQYTQEAPATDFSIQIGPLVQTQVNPYAPPFVMQWVGSYATANTAPLKQAYSSASRYL